MIGCDSQGWDQKSVTVFAWFSQDTGIQTLDCHTIKATASQVALVVKNPPANGGDMRHRFDPWVENIS